MDVPNDFKNQQDAWVQYNVGSGVVKKVYLTDPGEEKPAPGCEIFKTRLTSGAILNTHLLVVQNGRVVHGPSLAGI
jgi:hypothetical protein